MNVVLAKTETGPALSDAFAVARDRLPGKGKIAEQAGRRSTPMNAQACRTGGSRTGNTLICAC